MNPTPEQIARHVRDLTQMSGGEAPTQDPLYFHDGWSAYFASEIAALRVANHYAGPNIQRVKQVPCGWWAVSTKKAS